MEPEARYTLIGAVVLALIAVAVLTLLWLSGAGSASEFRNYLIVFERQSLRGLQIGSDVNMRGIAVGRVEDFSIARDNINRVSVVVRVSNQTPVSTNTEAIINRNLVTSLARIDLVTPDTPGEPLETPPPGQSLPIIAEGKDNLDEITETGKTLIASADEALRNVNDLLSPDNRRAVAGILTGIGAATESLDTRLAAFEVAAQSIQGTAEAFRMTAESMGGSLDRIGDSFNPLARDARAVMNDMRKALRDISRAVGTMEKSTATLAASAADVAELGTSELRSTANEMRNAVDILSRTLDRLQDPRAALLGPGERQLGPGEAK